MSGYKLIVAGSRSIRDYDLFVWSLENTLRLLAGDRDLKGRELAEIVSGHAWCGVDRMGERYAEEHGIPVARFPARWAVHGKAAGPIRNREMAAYADALFLMWDGESRGSRNMLDEAEKAGLKITSAVLGAS